MIPLDMMPGKQVPKVWGGERILVSTEDYCLKTMFLRFGKQCSLHAHIEKDETFIVWSGAMYLQVGSVAYLLCPGDKFRIEPGELHRFTAADLFGCVFFEVSTHDDPEDTNRMEESGDVPDDQWVHHRKNPPQSWGCIYEELP